jgi:hypothetical protein
MPVDPGLRKLAADVAAALEGSWVPGSHGDGWDSYAEIREGASPDAPTIRITRPSWGSPGRLRIGGVYPVGRERPYHLDTSDITVADTKPAERVAGDISRRLLPGYRADLARLIAYDEEQQRFHAARQAAAERLAAVLPPNARVSADRRSAYGEVSWWSDNKSPAGRIHRLQVKIDYQGREVTELELSAVPLELAEQILKLVAP